MAKWKIPSFTQRSSFPALGTISPDAEGVFTARNSTEDRFFKDMGGTLVNDSGSLHSNYDVPDLWATGDSVPFSGWKGGAAVGDVGASFGSGLNTFFADFTTAAGNATLTWDRVASTLTYAAPGDSAGPAVFIDRSQRLRLYSANGQWLELSIFFDALSIAASASATMAVTNVYVASMLRGWPEYLRFITKNRIRIANACVPGASIRHMPDILRGIPVRARVIVGVGTNDVLNSRTNAQIMGDVYRMMDSLVLYDAAVTSIPALAWNTQAKRNAWNAINSEILPRACLEYGIPFLPIWDATVDPVSTTAPKASRLQGDNVHPAHTGGIYAGREVAQFALSGSRFRRVSPRVGPLAAYDATNNPLGNLLTNSGFDLGAGGTLQTGVNFTAQAGGIPAGWVLQISGGTVTSGTAGLVAAEDGGNPWLDITYEGATAGTIIKLENGSAVNTYPGSTVPVPGNKMAAACEWRNIPVDAGSVTPAVRGVEMRITPVGVTNTLAYIAGFVNDAMNIPNLDMEGATPMPEEDYTVLASTTAVRGQLNVVTGAGSGHVRLRSPVMRMTQ